MVEVITNFNKDDCLHYAIVAVPGCCGRRQKGGVCTVADGDGIQRRKICSTKMSYCVYTKKEEGCSS
jgi:hypothetical protein